MKNDGLENELEIIEELNGKQFKDLSPYWQNKMKQLFRSIKEDDFIECYKCIYNQKADIAVKCGSKKWNISIKSGYFVSVHSELLSSFCGFLRSLGIDENLINTLRLYHFGDGTIDGTGEVRKPLEEIKMELRNQIEDFNEAVNKPDVLRKIINRFICCGTPYQQSYVTHILWGTKEYGNMIDIKTLVDYICSGYAFMCESIHFGPFIYTPAYRGVKNFNKDNLRRYYINIKWPSLNRDMRDAKDWYFRISGLYKREEKQTD